MGLLLLFPILFIIISALGANFFSKRIYRTLQKNENKNAKIFQVISFILILAILLLLFYALFIMNFSLER
jgi:hypothetical protein